MTVVVAARGYPGAPTSGGAIRLIEAAEQVEGVTVFHAGTTLSDGGLVAKGGRVLAVTAVADTSQTPARAPIAVSIRSTSPTASTAAISAGASWSGS